MSASPLGSSSRPLRVAVIGSGPSAFYAVDALFKVEGLVCRCDVFDRLPTPFGLVRGGVAPDHQKIKSVTRVYEKTAAHPGFRFFGNVKLGRDLQVDDLTKAYDQIIYAVGNESSRDLGIPGEQLTGVASATEFVFWYNGHPDYRDCQFDLAGAKRVAVVGNGNVAMDVCRVLIQSPERLAGTDIADYALDALRGSGIREVLLLGRRGPAQSAFSPKEIEEVAGLEDVDLIVDPAAVDVDPVTARWLEGDAPKSAHKNLKFLTRAAGVAPAPGHRRVDARFLVSPVELTGSNGKLTGVRLERNEIYEAKDGSPRPKGTGNISEEPIDMVFKAIGYRGIPIDGVPFHDAWGIIPNVDGRVVAGADDPTVVAGQYVVGWSKRGPSGLIGTNSPDSKATVEKMVEDLQGRTAEALPDDEAEQIPRLLAERGIRAVSFAEWQRLDALEQERGRDADRVRQKFTDIPSMLAALAEPTPR